MIFAKQIVFLIFLLPNFVFAQSKTKLEDIDLHTPASEKLQIAKDNLQSLSLNKEIHREALELIIAEGELDQKYLNRVLTTIMALSNPYEKHYSDTIDLSSLTAELKKHFDHSYVLEEQQNTQVCYYANALYQETEEGLNEYLDEYSAKLVEEGKEPLSESIIRNTIKVRSKNRSEKLLKLGNYMDQLIEFGADMTTPCKTGGSPLDRLKKVSAEGLYYSTAFNKFIDQAKKPCDEINATLNISDGKCVIGEVISLLQEYSKEVVNGAALEGETEGNCEVSLMRIKLSELEYKFRAVIREGDKKPMVLSTKNREALLKEVRKAFKQFKKSPKKTN